MSSDGSADLPSSPRCAVHPDALATFTCERCGAFSCAQCRIAGTGLCARCAARQGAVPLDLGTTIGTAYALSLRALPSVLPLALVMMAVAIPNAFTQSANTRPGERPDIDALFAKLVPALGGACLAILISPLVHGAFVALLGRLASGGRASLGDALSVALRRYLPYVGLLFTLGIPVGIGMLCCLLPGIALYVMLALAPPALILANFGPISALERSWALVTGHFWEILLGTLATGLPVVVASIFSALAGAVAARMGFAVRLPVVMASGLVGALAILPLYAFTVLAFQHLGGGPRPAMDPAGGPARTP